jgi:hypothetical protein
MLPLLFHYGLLNFNQVLVLVLALVYLLLCTFSVLACYTSLAVGKHLMEELAYY